jgi:hypothetical protein
MGAGRRARLLHPLPVMTDDRIWSASGKLQLIREFLHREFRDCHHRDFFAIDESAQVFLIETGRGFRHMLVIPRTTFECADFNRLCNAQLSATLKLAREGRVLLTPQGPRVSRP